jgi:hypothetical protein
MDDIDPVLEKAIEDAIHAESNGQPSQAPRGHGEEDPRDQLPHILVRTAECEVNEEAAQALARDTAIYQRGNCLVHIVRDDSPAAKGIRRPFAPRIDVLPRALLREKLTEHASWWKAKSSGDWEGAHPPGWCVSAVHARGRWEGIRHLEAIVDYPVLRPDGSILSRPGYDADTGLLLLPKGDMPEILERPTKDQAIRAKDFLFENLLSDFPFQLPVHRAAWLAGLLTPLARFAFTGPAPLFLVDSNVRGSGKGLSLDCIAYIVSGDRFTVASWTKDEDELRKRITSLAMSGDRLILFDNLSGAFGNATLDAALTATTWKDRILGVNRMAECPLYPTWYATGNNVSIAADTARRCCHIRLESPEEKPETRQAFKYPQLLEWVAENRSKLLRAALTILRAYFVAGKPDMRLQPWGSFQEWSALVRGTIVWLGLHDPGETRLLLQEQADMTAESMGILLGCLEQLDPSHLGLTAAEIIEKIKNDNGGWHGDLRDAVESLIGKLDSRALGTKFRFFRRRVFKGRYIDRVGTNRRAVRWAVFPASAFSQPRNAGSGEPGSQTGQAEPRPPSEPDKPDPQDPYGAEPNAYGERY